jgi:quinohemoprotein ethanol dehydrogenase
MLHAPKNGFFYVIDRRSGEVISAEPFVATTWASSIDLETGRPVEVPGARYEDGLETVAPSPLGGHNWHAMSFNPLTGLAFYPAIHLNSSFDDRGIDLETYQTTQWIGGTGVGGGIGSGSTRDDGLLSSLQAWDPVRKEIAWEVPLPGLYNPGTMTTAGNLVFQGRIDGTFVAYRADTGEELWTTDVGLGITAPPITYSVDGRQYVALLVGWGGIMAGLGGRLQASYGWAYGVHTRMLVAFSLEGAAALPTQPDPVVPEPIEAEFEVDSEMAMEGAVYYGQRCSLCHGPATVSGGLTPDLRGSRIVASLERFAGVVRDGIRADDGMPAYADITYDELVALQHYIRDRAEAALAERDGGEN